MRKLKGFVALTLVMSLMAASLTGCGGSSEKKESATATDSNPLKGKKLVMAINAYGFYRFDRFHYLQEM